MSERELHHQDDELDVEELEAVAGGNELVGDSDTINNCPITNYQNCGKVNP
jgi:hypothetical protein